MDTQTLRQITETAQKVLADFRVKHPGLIGGPTDSVHSYDWLTDPSPEAEARRVAMDREVARQLNDWAERDRQALRDEWRYRHV